ncbi:hypothetical protein GCM10022405_23710 [Gibbsiella dentisursi]|uniref:Uncharacterized protein n=1 Tax=Gibbsiella dentisursi TaxID=796890 RepID=A0ABP7LDZ4_9GAMM
MFGKIKYAMKYHRRARLSYFFNCVLLSVFLFVVMNVITSVYVSAFPGVKINQPVSSLTSFGFSISFGYGLIYSFVVIVTGFVFMLLNVQRLRDMGYRYPVVVSLLLIIFSQVSDFLDNLVKMNFISLFIDMGLLVFFIIMLFTESKKQTTY